MKFKNLRFSTKQTIGFGLILSIMVLANIFSIKQLATIRDEVQQVSFIWLQRAIAISDINLYISNLRQKQLQHAFTIDKEGKQNQADVMIEIIDNINENVDKYENLREDSELENLYSKEENEFYGQFNKKLEEYLDLSFSFFQLSRENKTEEAVNLLNVEAQIVYRDLSSILERLVSISKNNALNAALRAERTFLTTRNISIFLLAITVILSVSIAFLLIRYTTIPLKFLVSGVKKVAEGDLDVTLDIESEDEIGNLSKSFNQMTLALKDARKKSLQEEKLRAESAELKIKAAQAETRAIKAENERKTQELEQARKLQLSMLPEKLPEIPYLAISVYMKTATEVGGDYYDFKSDDNETLTVALGDATGHGLHAGTVVAATKSLFNAFANQYDPVETFKKASQALKEMGFHQMYMAMLLAKFNQNQMILSSAGMPHTLLYKANLEKVEEIVLSGMPLGSFPNYNYKNAIINIDEGDTILFMSDGITERFNNKGETLGEERTKQLFAEIAMKSTDQIIDHMVKAGEDWANGRTLDDDITFVAIKKIK